MSKNQLIQSRKFAFDRQDGKCFYCGLQMWLDGPPGPTLLRCTAEHLRARSEGGGGGRSNIVAACWHCNSKRHKRKHPPDPLQYRDEVRRRLQMGGWMPKGILAQIRRSAT